MPTPSAFHSISTNFASYSFPHPYSQMLRVTSCIAVEGRTSDPLLRSSTATEHAGERNANQPRANGNIERRYSRAPHRL